MIVENFVIRKGSCSEANANGERVIEMQIDKNSFFSVIDVQLATALDLEFKDEKRNILFGGRQTECSVATPVVISFGDRSSFGLICVLPELERPILGRRALMEMDLVVDEASGTMKHKVPATVFLRQRVRILN